MGSDVFSCGLDPDTRTVLRIYLFTNVQNMEAIRNNIVQGAWNCSVVNASLVADPLQVAAAANKAVVAQMQNSMVTKTVYAEIIYNLSLTKNISQSLNKFGIEKGNSLLFCFLITDEKDETESIIAQIEGEQRPVSELPNYSDMKQIKSAYKLNNLKDSADFLDCIGMSAVNKEVQINIASLDIKS